MRQALLAPGAADANGGLQEMRQALLAPGAADASGGLQEMRQASAWGRTIFLMEEERDH